MQRIKMVVYAIVCLTICTSLYNSLLAQSVSAQDCNAECCLQKFIPPTLMTAMIHAKGKVMVSYRFQTHAMKGLKHHTNKIGDDEIFREYEMSSDRMTMQMHMVMGMVGITDRITLMGMLQYMQNEMNMIMPTSGLHPQGHVHESLSQTEAKKGFNTSGLGDATINLTYKLFSNEHHTFTAFSGLSIPIGDIGRKGTLASAYPNQRVPYNMQLGSGTWDILPGINYSLQTRVLALGSSVSGNIHTSYNKIRYRRGDEFMFQTWGSYHWAKILTNYLRVEAISINAIAGKDPSLYRFKEPASNPANTGGKSVSIYCGLEVFAGRALGIDNVLCAELGMPVYEYVYGYQMPDRHSILFNWSISF